MSANVYEIITTRILTLLEQGTVPWHRPWAADQGMPRNLFSQRPYNGINVWLLGSMGYASPFWATFNQVRQAGGNVKRGEKACPVVFWKRYDGIDHETGDHEKRFVLRYYNVFNSSQVEGVAVPVTDQVVTPFTPIETCENLVICMPQRPIITREGVQAYYRPSADVVVMPPGELFTSPEEFYSTLFHELGHSTGHESRLGRKTLTDLCPFGSTNYSKEELVAEMTAAYLCAVCGIENRTVTNSAAYIAGWKRALKNDPRCVVTAAAQAQKAADFIQNLHQHQEDHAQ